VTPTHTHWHHCHAACNVTCQHHRREPCPHPRTAYTVSPDDPHSCTPARTRPHAHPLPHAHSRTPGPAASLCGLSPHPYPHTDTPATPATRSTRTRKPAPAEARPGPTASTQPAPSHHCLTRAQVPGSGISSESPSILQRTRCARAAAERTTAGGHAHNGVRVIMTAVRSRAGRRARPARQLESITHSAPPLPACAAQVPGYHPGNRPLPRPPPAAGSARFEQRSGALKREEEKTAR
jgi:hypothetical protein